MQPKHKNMAANGRTVILNKEEKAELKRKIATFVNKQEYCDMNNISVPLLTYPLATGRCSTKTYEKIIASKTKEEIELAHEKKVEELSQK